MDKPVIAIAMGDPAGIGPELIVKVLSASAVWEECSPFVVGDIEVMQDISQVLGADLCFRAIESPAEARFSPPMVDVLRPGELRIDRVSWGELDPAMGRAAALCLQKAFELAAAGEVQGVVSAPLNKEAFHLAGYQHRDDLSYLADLTGSREPFILGVISSPAGSVFTITVTEHVAFREILDLIDKDRVLWCIRKIDDVLRRAGLAQPRIAVAALNVHAGEGGLFGREEIDEIEPAIQEAREQGIDAEGPVPADMVFVRALGGDFDGVVCMYHDQATIARKLQPKDKGATLFMGLPVPCGTTAHGTAFDIAGKGIADPGSLQAALGYTVNLASQVEIVQAV
jgi:4-hydroxythreonine-4-phosphate dehydrogenase